MSDAMRRVDEITKDFPIRSCPKKCFRCGFVGFVMGYARAFDILVHCKREWMNRREHQDLEYDWLLAKGAAELRERFKP